MSDANRAQIRAVYSTRHLLASSGGPAFVKGLKLANEELKAECLRLYQGERGDHTHPSQEEGPLTAFAHFISQQWEAASEGNLVGNHGFMILVILSWIPSDYIYLPHCTTSVILFCKTRSLVMFKVLGEMQSSPHTFASC